jgi:hypothetical protein
MSTMSIGCHSEALHFLLKKGDMVMIKSKKVKLQIYKNNDGLLIKMILQRKTNTTVFKRKHLFCAPLVFDKVDMFRVHQIVSNHHTSINADMVVIPPFFLFLDILHIIAVLSVILLDFSSKQSKEKRVNENLQIRDTIPFVLLECVVYSLLFSHILLVQ